jgi:cytochrome c-type biogenesis protein CcmH
VLLGGGLAMWRYARRRSKGGLDAAPAALTAAEEARLAALMSADAPAKKS